MATQIFAARSVNLKGALLCMAAGLALACSVALGFWTRLCQGRAAPLVLAPASALVNYDAGDASTVVDVGTVRAGGRAEAPLCLTNHSDSWIDIASVRTSCPCLAVHLLNPRLGPGQMAEAIARVDLSDEPLFAGGLCPEIEFLDSRGRTLIALQIEINVLPHASEHGDPQAGIDRNALLERSR